MKTMVEPGAGVTLELVRGIDPAGVRFSAPFELRGRPGYEVAASRLVMGSGFGRDTFVFNTVTVDPDAPRQDAISVTYAPLSSGYVGVEDHPLEVLTCGEYVCGTLAQESPQLADAYGRWAYERLMRALELSPDFGAITVECPVPVLNELLGDDGPTRVLSDFYVSNRLLSELSVKREELLALCAGGYSRITANGVYLSSSHWFNPDGLSAEDPDRPERIHTLLRGRRLEQ